MTDNRIHNLFNLANRTEQIQYQRKTESYNRKSNKNAEINMRRNKSANSNLNGNIFPEFLHGNSDDNILKLSINITDTITRKKLHMLAKDSIKKNDSLNNFKNNLLGYSRGGHPFEFDTFILQDTDSLYYETVGDGLCGWYTLSQISHRNELTTPKKPIETIKTKRINLTNRKDRIEFQCFLKKLRTAIDQHPDKNGQIINAIDNITSWIISPQGYANPSNNSDTITMTDIYSQLELHWLPNIFDACNLDNSFTEMSSINASLFISKETHSMTHPYLPSLNEGSKKWTHLIYYSGQPNKVSSFSFPTIRNILNKPNFFYKNHNHYYLLPLYASHIYRSALESALLNLCSNILQFVKSSMITKQSLAATKSITNKNITPFPSTTSTPRPLSKPHTPIINSTDNDINNTQTSEEQTIPDIVNTQTSDNAASNDLPCTQTSMNTQTETPTVTEPVSYSYSDTEQTHTEISSISSGEFTITQTSSTLTPDLDSDTDSLRDIHNYATPDTPASNSDSDSESTSIKRNFDTPPQNLRSDSNNPQSTQHHNTSKSNLGTTGLQDNVNEEPPTQTSETNNIDPQNSDPCRNPYAPLSNLSFRDFYILNFLSKTVTHIPSGNVLNKYRSLCNTLLTEAENAYAQGNEDLATMCWKKFFLLPSIILTNRKDNQSTRNIMLHNLTLLANDDWSSFTIANLRHVIQKNQKTNHTSTPKTNDDFFVRRITELVGAGNISKAFKSLNPTPIAPGNANTTRILRELHPQRLEEDNIVFEPPSFEDSEPFSFQSNQLRQKVRECANLTAPGTSKLRIDHIKQLLGTEKCLEGENFCIALAGFISRIANGLLPEELIRFLGSGTLIALSKDNSNTNVRPIVLGETLRKLAAGMALDSHKGPIQDHFKGIQYGFKTPNGIEFITHAANVSHQIHPEWDRLFIDFKNAFNNIIRKFAISNILEKFPRLSRYAIAYYGITTELWYTYSKDSDDPFCLSIIDSEEGAQQGDSFGPFLFSMGAHPLFVEADRIAGAGFCKALLDDGSVIAPHEDCIKVLQFFIDEGPKYGFHLNPSKTKILLGACKDNNEPIQRTLSYNKLLNIPTAQLDSNIMTHPTNLSSRTSPEEKSLYGTRVLGSPIGSDEYILSWLNNYMIKLSEDISRVAKFPNKQCQWLFLYNVIRNKVTHLLRSVKPVLTSHILNKFNREIRSVFEKILDTKCSDATWIQVTLPFDEGGFNLTDLTNIYIPAYLSSCISVLPELSAIFPELESDLNKDNNFSYEWCFNLNNNILETSRVASDASINLTWLGSQPHKHLQRKLSNFWISASIKKFTDECTSSHSKIRIASLKDNSSSAFLLAIPKCGENKFSNSQLTTAFRIRLGIPLSFVKKKMKCSCKDNPIIDPLGDHFHACPVGNLRQARHNKLTTEIKHMLAYAGISSEYEPSLGLADKNVRPDLLAHHPSFEGFGEIPEESSKNIYFDISVTHPTNTSLIKTNKDYLTSGFAAKAKYSEKMRKYKEIISKKDALFLPLIFETYGLFHPMLKQLIVQTAKKASSFHSIPEEKITNYWTIRLSCMLQKGNANLLESRAQSLDKLFLNKDSWIGQNPEYIGGSPSN